MSQVTETHCRSGLFNHSLQKGLGILRAFNAANRTMTLSDIARTAQITKSSAQRMVHTLEQLGYITRHPRTKRYQLSVKSLEIGFNYLATDTLVDIATPFLAELTATTGETCSLTKPDRLEMVYLARVMSPKFVPVHMPIGSRIPIYCSASGRAYLSALPEPEWIRVLSASEMKQLTPHTITSVLAQKGLLQQAREEGYAYNKEEMFLGDMTVAAVVLNIQRTPIASVHVAAPTNRWTLDEARDRIAPSVMECARSISRVIRTVDY